jgi:hypothetical protein
VETGECWRTVGDDEIRCEPDQFSRVVPKAPDITARLAVLDREVLSFHPAELVQALPQGTAACPPSHSEGSEGRNRTGSNDTFDRASKRLRYCNMRFCLMSGWINRRLQNERLSRRE